MVRQGLRTHLSSPRSLGVLTAALMIGTVGIFAVVRPGPSDDDGTPTQSAPGPELRPDPSDRTEATSITPFAGLLTAGSTGLAPHGLTCAELRPYTGPDQVPAGATISRRRFAGPLDLSAGGITIEQSCFQPTAVWRGLPVTSTTDNDTGTPVRSPVVIRDSEFDGSLLPSEDAAFSTGFIGVADLTGNYLHGLGSGFAIMNAGQELDARIEGNYVTGLVAWGDGATTGNHSSAFTVRDFSAATRPDRRLVVRGNRFDSRSGNDTGALFIQTDTGPIDHVLVEGNLLEGNGYQLGLEEKNFPYSDIRVVGNRATGTGWGAAYVTGGPGPSRWQDNHLFDPHADGGRGEPLPRP